jgi:hypothetical protein
MSAYDDALNSVNASIAELSARRPEVPFGSVDATTLDEDIAYLQNKRDQINQQQVIETLAALQASTTLNHLESLISTVNETTDSLEDTANLLGTAAQIVSAVAALVAFILPLVA